MEKEILAYLEELSRLEKCKEPEGYHYLETEQGELETFCCTHTAILVAKKFNGRVFGYPIHEYDENIIGILSGGHDFAVIGNLIIDWWATKFEEHENPIMRIGSPEALRHYLPREKWEEVPIGEWDQTLKTTGPAVA